MSVENLTTLLVGTDDIAYGASLGSATLDTATTPDDLRLGALGIFDESNTLIVSSTADTDSLDEKIVRIGQGLGAGLGAVLSPPIDRRGLLNFRQQAYVAPVKQITTITPTAAAAPTVNDEYTLVVIDTTRGNLPEDRYRYTAIGSFASATLVGDAIRTAIAADTDAIVVGSGTTTIILTAVNFGVHFRVALSENLEGDTIVYTTPWNPGRGDGTSLVALETDLNVYRGQGNPDKPFASKYGTFSTYASTALTYDTYYIEVANIGNQKDGMGAMFARKHTIMVAQVVGSTGITAWALTAVSVFGPAAAAAPEAGA